MGGPNGVGGMSSVVSASLDSNHLAAGTLVASLTPPPEAVPAPLVHHLHLMNTSSPGSELPDEISFFPKDSRFAALFQDGPLQIQPAPAPSDSGASPSNSARLKVMTVNAFAFLPEQGTLSAYKTPWFSTPDTLPRIHNLAKFIARVNPDVVLFQEVWQKYLYDRLVADLITEGYFNKWEAKSRAVYFSDLGSGNTDLAMVSKFDLESTEFKPFIWQGSARDEAGTMISNEKPIRGVGTAEVVLPNGQRILIADTHPMHRRAEEKGYHDYEGELSAQRGEQLAEARTIIAGHDNGQPIIFGGDMNFSYNQWEYEKVFHPLFEGFRGTFDFVREHEPVLTKSVCTFCGDNPYHPGESEGVLDHVFGNSLVSFKNVRVLKPRRYRPKNLNELNNTVSQVVPGGPITDHEIVLAEVEVQKAPLPNRKLAKAGERTPITKAKYEKVNLDAGVLAKIRESVTPEKAPFHWYAYLSDVLTETRRVATMGFLASLHPILNPVLPAAGTNVAAAGGRPLREPLQEPNLAP